MRKKYVLNSGNRSRSKAVRLPGVILLCLVFFLGALTLTKNHASTQAVNSRQTISVPETTRPVMNYGLPVEIKIPKIKVVAPVIYLGTTKKGNMDVPKNIADTGWYKGGALPGNDGTSVIAGHLSGPKGEAAVFKNLGKLVEGDEVMITDSNKRTIVFVVREKRNYNQNEQPTEVFNSSSGSHLNLITCSGAWDSEAREFTKRLVIFTDKIN